MRSQIWLLCVNVAPEQEADHVIPPVLQLCVPKVKHVVQAQSQVGIRFSYLAFIWKIRPVAEQVWDNCLASIRRF